MLTEDQVRAIYAESMKHRDPIPYIHQSIEAAVLAEQAKQEPVAYIDEGDLREVGAGNSRYCHPEDQGRMVGLVAAPVVQHDEKGRPMTYWGGMAPKAEQAKQEPVGEVSGNQWDTALLYQDMEPGQLLYAAPVVRPELSKLPLAQSITDAVMELVDRLGSECADVDPRAWNHLRVYLPKAEQPDDLKDAERYRWLRDTASHDDWDRIGVEGSDTLDAAIDAAMAAEKEQA